MAWAMPCSSAMAQEYQDGGIYYDEDGVYYRYSAATGDFTPLSEEELAELDLGDSYEEDYSGSSQQTNAGAPNNYVHIRGQRSGSSLGVTKFPVTDKNRKYVELTPYVDTAYKMFDFAGVLSDRQIRDIEKRAHLFCDRTGCDIAIVILASCDHPTTERFNTTESFICDFYDYNDFKRDGVMLCLDLQHSRNSVFDAGKLYDESFMGGRLEEYGPVMRPYFDRRQYYEEIMWFIEHAEADWLYECSFPVWKCVIFGSILALLIYFVHTAKYQLVFKGTTANNYKVADSFNLTRNETTFVRTFTTKTYSPQSKGGSGGGSSSGGGHSGGSF